MKKQPTLFPILAVVFTNILGAGMVIPILPLYAVNQFGASDFQAALLTTAFFAAQFLAAPVLGKLSDRFGRRPILMLSQFGTFLAFMLFLFAPQLGHGLDMFGLPWAVTGGLVIMFVARSLDGLTGGNITTAQAYITDVATEENRTQSLGALSAARGIAFIIGPGLGGLLSKFGIQWPFIGAALITLATIALTYFMLVETMTVEKRQKKNDDDVDFSFIDLLQNPNILILVVLEFLAISAFASLPPTFTLYIDRVIYPDITDTSMIVQRVGWIFMASGTFQVLTQAVLLRPLVRRLGERRLVMFGFFVWATGMFFFPMLKNAWLIALGMFPYAFSRGVIDPSLQSLITRFSGPKTHGSILGLFQSAVSMAMIIGPIWAGWVFEMISPASVFSIAGGILVAGLLLSLLFLRKELPQGEHTIR